MFENIKIISMNITEAGCGKSPLDAHFCYDMIKMESEVLKGLKDIKNAKDAVRNLNAGGGVANSEAVLVEIIIENLQELEKNNIKGIKKWHHYNIYYENDEFIKIGVKEINNRGEEIFFTKIELLKYMKYTTKGDASILKSDFNHTTNASVDLPLTTNDKNNKNEKKKLSYDKKNNIIKEENLKKQELINNIIEKADGQMFFCNYEKCKFACRNLQSLENHVNEGKHTYTSIMPFINRSSKLGSAANIEQVPFRDAAIFIAENSTPIKTIILENNNIQSTTTNNSYKLIDKSDIVMEPLKYGFCTSQESTNEARSIKQLEFIINLFKLGVKDKNKKISANMAEEIMYLAGTQAALEILNESFLCSLENIKQFRFIDLLDEQQIKHYFGLSEKTLDEMIKRKKQQELNQENKRIQNQKYCYCKKKDDGNEMIQCLPCGDWFHFKCIQLEEYDWVNLSNINYICQNCKIDDSNNYFENEPEEY